MKKWDFRVGFCKNSSKVMQARIHFREILVSEVAMVVKAVSSLGGPTEDGKIVRIIYTYDKEADHLCQCIEKSILFGLRTRSKTSHLWPMITALFKKLPPENPVLNKNLKLVGKTSYEWDKGRVLIRMCLNDSVLAKLFTWIGKSSAFLHKWYISESLFQSPRRMRQMLDSLEGLSKVHFELNIHSKPRYSWNIYEYIPSIHFEYKKRMQKTMRVLTDPQDVKRRMTFTGRGGKYSPRKSLSPRIRYASPTKRPLSVTVASPESVLPAKASSSSSSSGHTLIPLPSLEDDIVAFQALQDSGLSILVRDAAKAVERKLSYRAWLFEFSPRDACDPERGSRISSRAGITSAFAQSWIGAGGSFTADERKSMELTEDEKKQQEEFLLQRRKKHEIMHQHSPPPMNKELRRRLRQVRVVCHGRVYRMNLDRKDPLEFVRSKLKSLLGSKAKEMDIVVTLNDDHMIVKTNVELSSVLETLHKISQNSLKIFALPKASAVMSQAISSLKENHYAVVSYESFRKLSNYPPCPTSLPPPPPKNRKPRKESKSSSYVMGRSDVATNIPS